MTQGTCGMAIDTQYHFLRVQEYAAAQFPAPTRQLHRWEAPVVGTTCAEPIFVASLTRFRFQRSAFTCYVSCTMYHVRHTNIRAKMYGAALGSTKKSKVDKSNEYGFGKTSPAISETCHPTHSTIRTIPAKKLIVS